MKRIVLFLSLLLLAIPAHAQYLDGLPLAPSLSSTDIMPVCQGGTAGHPGTCKTYKTTLGSVLTFGLFNQNLNLGSGTLTAANAILGGATFSGPLHMGAFVIDGTNAQFTGGTLTGLTYAGGALTGTFTGSPTLSGAPTFSGTPVFSTGASLTGTLSGSPTFSGAPTFSGTPVFSTGAAMSGTFSGAHTYSGALTLSAAATALTVTNNESIGGTLTTGTGVTNGLLMSASTLSVTGTGNPVLTIKGLGTGGINFQTGATPFTGMQLTDGGASAINLLRIIPGTTGNGVSLQAVGDAAAVLNFKAGTSGTAGSAKFFIPVFNTSAIQQQTTFNLVGANPTALSTQPFYQNITMTGNNAALTNTNGLNIWNITDQAAVNGSMGVATFSQSYQAPADGDRNMADFVFIKSAASVSGGHTFGLARFFMHMDADEGGTGTTITASQAGTVLTVTAVGSAILAPQTVISGVGMVTTRIIGLGTGTGGTGTYSVAISQNIGSQTMIAGNYKGNGLLLNPDLQCNGGSWWKGCQLAEWDIRDFADSQYKTGLTINYATFDAGHGVSVDCAFCIGAGDFAPGTGKGRVMFSVGVADHTWPINTNDPNSAILRAQPHTFGTYGNNSASLYAATFGIDFTILECGTACWRSPGFTIDGAGQLSAGPLSIAYVSTGATITAPRVTTASAVVVAGGGSFKVGDEVLEPLTGSLWSVATLSGSAVATLTLAEAGYATSCPGAATPFTSLGSGVSLTATITCSTSNGIVLGASTDKLGFYGATAIVKATPVGACAGNTGCQAIRNALGNLGFINTGSISD